MASSDAAGAALTVLAAFIDRRAGEVITDLASDPEAIALAAERCTTVDVLCRAIEIGTMLSALMDRLDWPPETKMACREVLALTAQNDLAGLVRARKRLGQVN